ncbi:MAG: hypothetical protein AAF432_12395 [Planctomycetota bacterium]
MKLFPLLQSVLILFAVGFEATAQERSSSPEANTSAREIMSPDFRNDLLIFDTVCLSGSTEDIDDLTKELCRGLLKERLSVEQEQLLARYEFERKFLQQKLELNASLADIERRAFETQMDQGSYLFRLAIILSIGGAIAAAVQFRSVYKDAGQSSELRISGKDLTIKTAWIGVVILFICMVFLSYVIFFVYQISSAGAHFN